MSKIIALLLFSWLILSMGYAQTPFLSYEIAQSHPIISEGPAPDFFEGALIGNGGLGAVVCTRPDAIVIRFGHNNVWDIRIAEDNLEKIGTFQEVFEKVKNIDPSLKSLQEDPWYRDYIVMCRENYAKPYPRPFPCGSMILGFDRRKVEVIDTRLDISHGLVTIKLLLDQKKYADLLVFTDMTRDRVWMKLVDENGTTLNNCFNRIRLLPDQVTPKDFPDYSAKFTDRTMSFRQVMPSQEPGEYDKEKGHPNDHAFCLSVVTGPAHEIRESSGSTSNPTRKVNLERKFNEPQPFWACIALDEGLSENTQPDLKELNALTLEDFGSAYDTTVGSWKDYWEKSGVLLEDKFLEGVWYRNLYFFNCAAKSGVNCPGLFANWCFGDIGTAWHGDYHMNYNVQQPFWMTFSSNHLEKNLPYVELIEFLSEVSKITARDYYGMRGAFYPHSAYPVKMTMSPYPLPTWGWEVFETPWAVQGVWWHYLYSGDLEFLRTRAFPLMKDAVIFLVDYMTRSEAHGEQWNDHKYHVFPTVPPELYGLMPGFRNNSDCIVDLTLIKFLFKSYLKSVVLLEIEKQEKENVRDVQKILANYPDYPTAVSEEYGEVFVSVSGESPNTVYNVPNPLMAAFPGEDYGLHSDEETISILSNTKKNSLYRGCNEIVFQHLQAARIGLLDLEVFKREIVYNLLPNGTCTDNFLMLSDNRTHDRLAHMGIWFENFALPAVINECMMQSYNGIIRLFPNWPEDKNGQFRTLRAAGGFLVSGAINKGAVKGFQVKSEKGGSLKFYNPWDSEVIISSQGKRREVKGEIIEIQMNPGESLSFQPDNLWSKDLIELRITSSLDGTIQKAFAYSTSSDIPKPLIVSLHTWSGNYTQMDTLSILARERDWNYIHPDFRGANYTNDACLSSLALTDIDEAIDFAINHSNVDTSNIFVVGVSGGGYAALGCYMKSKHPIRKISSWVPISDLVAWYKESRIRGNKYADDILNCTSSSNGILNIDAAKEKSPINWETPSRNTVLEIHAGVYDGIQGSVPITHSINFYNKIIRDKGATDEDYFVSDKEKLHLLEQRKPLGNNGKIGSRDICLRKRYQDIQLTIFTGRHEMLSKYAFKSLMNGLVDKGTEKPNIEKLGIIAIDLVEATPFVFKNKVYRLEWVRPNTKHNPSDTSYLHIANHKTGKEISAFGQRHRFPCAYVEKDTVYVVGTFENLGWHGTILTMFKSGDLKTWTSETIYDAPEELHQICNTSLCKTDEGYALMFEISGTPEAGVGFTPRFLTSKDLKTFQLTSPACTFGRDRYSAPHCLRFHNGWYYSFYLEAKRPRRYEQYLLRSKDLIHWESSPFNPVLAASKEDKLLARNHFTKEERKAISEANDLNNSDIDFCEYKGKLIITYSWGNQSGQEHLAEALYDGTMGEFLEGWFPND